MFSMLANDDVVREVGLDGRLLSSAKRGLVHVNLATISIDLADALSSAHRSLWARICCRPRVWQTGRSRCEKSYGGCGRILQGPYLGEAPCLRLSAAVS